MGFASEPPPEVPFFQQLHTQGIAADEPIICVNPHSPGPVTASASLSTRPPDPLTIVGQFNDAFNRHDVDAIMAMMTEDCVFENTRPAPDGTRYVGQEAVRAFWQLFFANSPQARFEFTDLFAADDRAVVRWTYHWVKNDTAGHVRGVDVFRIRDGKVAEKLSYVKG